MNKEIKKLLASGAIICGKIINENGIIRFGRVSSIDLETIPEKDRAYATLSMGRAIFTIDSKGKIHNFKGVDSHLETSELGPAELVNAKSIEYVQDENKYKVSAIVFNGQKPEIRINGTSPLEDIEIEGDINKSLSEIGLKVPKIKYIREIPQEFSLKYGLPIKIKGSLNDFRSDYSKEDDKRKARLSKIYGDYYTQDLREGQRPESMSEYLLRIGFLSSETIQSNIKSLGFSMQDFIDAVDKFYSRGQRYGQAERIMDNPFRISDLETCIAHNNIAQLKSIMDFSEKQNAGFEEKLAECFGKNIAVLISNGWECENLIHRQDFSLGGEFCDDSYFNIFERQKTIKEKNKSKPYIIDSYSKQLRRRYSGQVMHIASCIKIIQKSMLLVGKKHEQISKVLEKYVESFVSNLDINKMANLFNVTKDTLMQALLNEFSQKKNWTEKMAKIERKEGILMDDAIYNSHIENEGYYSIVSTMIAEKLRERYINKDEQISIRE